MKRRSPIALAALLFFALALLFQSPAPTAAQKPGGGGKCNGCYSRHQRCLDRGDAETCYAELFECLSRNGCPAPPPPAQ